MEKDAIKMYFLELASHFVAQASMECLSFLYLSSTLKIVQYYVS